MARGKALQGIFGEMLDTLLRRVPKPTAGTKAASLPSTSARTPPTPGRQRHTPSASPSASHPALTPDRIQHGTFHLTEAGVLPPWSGKHSPAIIDRALAPILHNPVSTFDHRLGTSEVTGHIGYVDGQEVAVFTYKDGPNKGSLASSSVPSDNQKRKWGLL